MTTPPRTLCSDLPHCRRPAPPSRSRAGCTAGASWRASPSWSLRDRSGLAQVVLPAGTAVPPEETTVRVTGTATANEQAPGGVEVTDAVARAAHRAGRDAPGRALAPLARRLAPHAARPRPGPVAPPGPARPLAARGRVAARLPLHPRRTRLHRGRDAQGGGYGDRVGGERVRGRLVRAAGVPRPEPAVLQAAAGRRLRAGLRGRAGVPRRAARHRPAPRGVPLARRRARLHPRPPRGAGGAAGRARRHGRGGRRPRRRRSPARGASLPVVPDEIPVIHFADALALVGAPADEPDLAPEHERALGAWALAEHGSDFLAVEGYPMAKRPFYTHPQPGRPSAGPTASTCSSAGWSWSREASGCTGRRTTSARSAPAARTRRRTTPTCRRSGTGCRRTAGSPSVSSGGSPGSSERPTSARSRSSRAT